MNRPKLFRQLFAAGLSAVLAVSAAGITAFAATPTQSGMIEMYVSSSNQYTNAAAALAAGMLEHQDKIDIKSYNVPKADIGNLLTATLARYPELFFVERQFSYYQNNGYITSFVPTYTYSASKCQTMLTAFYNEADKYIAKAQGKLSKCGDDFSRAVVLHDEIILDGQYNINNTSPYNMMVDKSGVCETYARVYAYLLAQCGIKSEIVDSDSMGHEWLMVKLDGSYYHVDITWDDPTPDKPGLAAHNYFLGSNNYIRNSSNITQHSGFTTVNSASNTKYDSYAFHDFNSKMCKLNTDDTLVYAIGSSGIVKYNYANNNTTNLVTISDKWYVSGNSGTFYIGIYSGLDNNNGLLYYNTPSKIYSYDPATGTKTAVYTNTNSKKLYGVRIRNNNLYGIVSTGANDTGTEIFVKTLPEEAVSDPVVNNSTVSKTTITLGSSITFKGAASGGSGSYTYAVYNKVGTSWVKIGSGANFTYTPTAAGTYYFKETVTDSDGDSADKQFTVTVKNPALSNVSTISSENITLGDSVTVTAAGKDGSGGYTYAIYMKAGTSWIKISSSNTASYRPTAVGTTYLKTTVTDSEGTSADKEFAVKVNPSALVNESTTDKKVYENGEQIVITGAASGGTAPYTYDFYYRETGTQSWETIVSGAASVKVTADAGTYDIKVTAKDSADKTADKTMTITVKAPELVNESTINADEFIKGESITVTGAASGGTAPYTYTYAYRYEGDEGWTVLDADSSFLTFTLEPGHAYIKVTANDSDGQSADAVFSITVNYEEVKNESTINKTEFTAGEQVVVTGAATGGSGEYTYEYYSTVSGESERTKLGEGDSFSFTAETGSYDIISVATATEGGSAEKTFTISVSEPVEPVKNESTINKTEFTAGEQVVVTGAATGGSGEYTYEYYCTVSGESGRTKLGEGDTFSFTAETGSYDIISVATATEGGSAEKTFTISVSEPVEPVKNESTINKTEFTAGEQVVVTGAATGGTGEYSFTCYYRCDDEDEWEYLGEDSSSFVINADAGSYQIKVNAADANGDSDEKIFYITVSEPVPELVNNSSLNSNIVTINTKVWMYGAAEGGKGDYTYTYKYKRTTSRVWTVIKEDVADDKVCFTPSAAGVFDLTVIAKDSAGTTAEKSFVLTVADGKSTAFTNTSTISTTGAAPGTRIFLYGSAEGSSGYKYAFYYKRTTARNWTILGTEFGTDTVFAFTPRTEGEFNIKIDVLDENGEIVSHVFALSMLSDYNDTGIINKSSINASTMTAGSRLTISGDAEGGTAPYTYAYYYKRAGAANWTMLGDFSDATSKSVTLRTAGDYIVKVAVKDSAGGMTSTNFDLTVTS